MALYKKDMLVGGTIVGMVVALMLAIMALSPKPEAEEPNSYIECVNKVALEAYVEDDVGDTFDAGFDAGLLAGELCK